MAAARWLVDVAVLLPGDLKAGNLTVLSSLASDGTTVTEAEDLQVGSWCAARPDASVLASVANRRGQGER